jgi:pyrimidine-specific ribonucleoside hydrolase
VLAVCGSAFARTNIWIDTDPSLGAPWREVNDAFALMLAFRSPEVRIVGISTTYGNAGVKRTTAVAHDLVRRFGASHIHPGAESPRDRSRQTSATEALAAALRKRRLTYVALGPLTNLAAFCRLHHKSNN